MRCRAASISANTSSAVFPGDEHLERRIRAYIRWNAAMMVHRAQRPGVEVGGHISTYASAAALYDVGFDHFFRGHSSGGGGDQIYFQGHASPGIYARAFLEGRLSRHELDQIAPFVPQDWSSLGTDGFGRSDTRPALRRHFKVDAPAIVLRVLEQLARRGEVDPSKLAGAIHMYQQVDHRRMRRS